MNARIASITERNINRFNRVFTPEAARKNAETLALIQTIMQVTEYVDRILLDMPAYSFSNIELYGVKVLIVRHDGINHEIFTANGSFIGVTDLAMAAAEYALAQGYIEPQYLQ